MWTTLRGRCWWQGRWIPIEPSPATHCTSWGPKLKLLFRPFHFWGYAARNRSSSRSHLKCTWRSCSPGPGSCAPGWGRNQTFNEVTKAERPSAKMSVEPGRAEETGVIGWRLYEGEGQEEEKGGLDITRGVWFWCIWIYSMCVFVLYLPHRRVYLPHVFTVNEHKWDIELFSQGGPLILTPSCCLHSLLT